MRITLLGTGDAQGVPLHGCACPACVRARNLPEFRRGPASALLEQGGARLLLDAGLTDLGERFPPDTLQAVLLTHFHPDHVQGLFHYRWGLGSPIPVYAPRDGEGCADLYRNHGLLEFRQIAPFTSVAIGGLSLTPLPLIHSRPTLGWACEDAEGGRFAYLTDTAGLPAETEAFLRFWRPQALVLDCTHAPRSDPYRNHNDLIRALAIGKALPPCALWLTHVSHQLDAWLLENPAALPADAAMARDGLVLSLAWPPEENGNSTAAPTLELPAE
jgi:phosphoribosyl 1,2-cyclic phosphate phosphodiesterase